MNKAFRTDNGAGGSECRIRTDAPRMRSDVAKAVQSGDVKLMADVLAKYAPDLKPENDGETRGAFKVAIAKLLEQAGLGDDEVSVDPADDEEESEPLAAEGDGDDVTDEQPRDARGKPVSGSVSPFAPENQRSTPEQRMKQDNADAWKNLGRGRQAPTRTPAPRGATAEERMHHDNGEAWKRPLRSARH